MKKFIFLLLPVFALAQFQFIPISADYSTFASTKTNAFVQVYLSLFQGNLKYSQLQNGEMASNFTTKLEIRQMGELVKELSHQYKNTTKDTSKLARYNQFVDIFNLELPYGNYEASVQLIDQTSGLKGEYRMDLKTIEPHEALYLSDVELCSSIKSDTTTSSMFYKNGLHVVPNPKASYDVLNPLFYYYVELNNLSYSKESPGQYTFQYYLTNTKGDTLRSRAPITKSIAGPRLVEIGGMNVVALPKGVYIFHAIAKDLNTGEQATIQKKFSVFKPGGKKEVAAKKSVTIPKIANFYIGFTKEQLKEEFSESKYIASRQEEKIFKNLEDVKAMQQFLTQFWARKSKSFGLPFGSYRRQYLQRVEIANNKYHSMGKKGWRTDMGRVFILYGEPDEYERHPNSIDQIPYVIWHYHNIEGGVEFIFADEDGFGDFRLIHSSYRKELQNPNWQQILNKRTGTNPY